MGYTAASILSKLEAIMKYLLLGVFILTVTVSTALAEEQTMDDTTTTLENSQTTESLKNESLPSDKDRIPAETKKIRPRNKWDFSGRPEDKKTKAKSAAEKIQGNKKYGKNNIPIKPKEKWKIDNTKETWKFPKSETTKSNHQPQ